MSAVLYCSKLNLTSDHIFDVYQNEELLYKILNILLGDICPDVTYEKDDSFLNEDGCLISRSIRYKLSIREKTDTFVDGYLCKDSEIYYKTFNEDTKELVKHSMPYTEAVRFYFDVYKETIVFHTANRLGYQEFNEAMTGVLNKILETQKREFRFEVVLRTEGLNITQIEKELRKINNIYELQFKFQPPNPDSDTLKRMQENGENFINTMEDANATKVSMVFSSKGGKGLNLDSDMIVKNLENIQGMNYVTGDGVAVSKGYVSVEAVDAHGKKYTTADSKPIKTVINSLDHFVKECKRVIASLG